ncbi:RNA pyrophosphohydrolase [Emcibacter nanhaiensis]|uniref:RNA pyrophosphohydrolase n=1 Tax=Emcibacter nanhaiensis TaxID=1505037 RepID=A0A501PNS0_9PROT|nr:RNA pyrophosphohydrolase [Emcibacter nanhaiensis]TPD61634.1 RNA pyrophosphohydrolase [Emcibacter nanhaiensis]
MTDKENLPYRPCAGMMLLNRDGRVFVAQRIDQTAEAWQMPQGGIDKGEEPRDAALRELEEEIGTDKVELIAETGDWLTYDLPDHLIGKVWKGRYRGQKMKWFVYLFQGQDRDINLETDHQEFSEWKWIELSELPDMIVPFKRDLYQTLVDRFGSIIQEHTGRSS